MALNIGSNGTIVVMVLFIFVIAWAGVRVWRTTKKGRK